MHAERQYHKKVLTLITFIKSLEKGVLFPILLAINIKRGFNLFDRYNFNVLELIRFYLFFTLTFILTKSIFYSIL